MKVFTVATLANVRRFLLRRALIVELKLAAP